MIVITLPQMAPARAAERRLGWWLAKRMAWKPKFTNPKAPVDVWMCDLDTDARMLVAELKCRSYRLKDFYDWHLKEHKFQAGIARSKAKHVPYWVCMSTKEDHKLLWRVTDAFGNLRLDYPFTEEAEEDAWNLPGAPKIQVTRVLLRIEDAEVILADSTT